MPPNADGFEELREGDEFFDNFSWLFVLLAVILRYVWHNNVSSFLLIWWILPAMIPEQFMLDDALVVTRAKSLSWFCSTHELI